MVAGGQLESGRKLAGKSVDGGGHRWSAAAGDGQRSSMQWLPVAGGGWSSVTRCGSVVLGSDQVVAGDGRECSVVEKNLLVVTWAWPVFLGRGRGKWITTWP